MEASAMHKFEKLEVWKISLEYVDLCYAIAEQLPEQETFNLNSQLRRAATSVALNIAEGSTSQSDAEQTRFLGFSIRSLLETVACFHLIHRRKYFSDREMMRSAYQMSEELVAKLQALRRTLTRSDHVRDSSQEYIQDSTTPFDDFEQ
jgi:four helix bundle protein